MLIFPDEWQMDTPRSLASGFIATIAFKLFGIPDAFATALGLCIA